MSESGTQTVRFERSAVRQLAAGGFAAIGGVAFLGMAAVSVLGILSPDIQVRLLGGGMFGFFGILLVAGAISGGRRGTDPRAVEISPAGAWLPEMGLLPWSELAEVRVERIRGPGGSRAPVTRQYRRLGFVPRDPSIRPSAATSLTWRMVRAYSRMLRAIAPQIRMDGDDPAPFGVLETEIPRDFDRLVETVARHVIVGDATQSRARARAARWSARSAAGGTVPADLATLDAALAWPASPTPAKAAAPVAEVLPGVTHAAATFVVPPVKPIDAILAIAPVAVPIAVIVPVILPMAVTGERNAIVGLALLAFFGLFFVIPGVGAIWRLVRRTRERRTDVARLRVGPDGIWTRESGLLPWGAVRAIRTERAGWVRQLGSPPVERWRLVVEATGPAARTGSAASDELDARFDDVLDLVRLYHPVIEPS